MSACLRNAVPVVIEYFPHVQHPGHGGMTCLRYAAYKQHVTGMIAMYTSWYNSIYRIPS